MHAWSFRFIFKAFLKKIMFMFCTPEGRGGGTVFCPRNGSSLECSTFILGFKFEVWALLKAFMHRVHYFCSYDLYDKLFIFKINR